MSSETITEGKIISGSFADSLDENFTRYAYLVIEDRALPDARDGLKPSQRRILVSMNDLKLRPNGSPKKSAKICGQTSGDYHPHGEQVVYPTLVRMAQDWVMRYPLVLPQGNFGNIDGDPPAAMRYTEARLSPESMLLLDDLSKDVVNFIPNYNEELEEPKILPAKIPNLLVNGASGIAVGYATNLIPHNLREVIEAIKAYDKDDQISTSDLMEIIPGPDFPNGGKVLGRSGIKDYFETGRGTLKIEGSWHVEESKGNPSAIIINQLPYLSGPTEFAKQVASLAENGEIQGISDVRDLTSNKNGLKVRIDLSKTANVDLIIATLQKKTCLRKSVSVNQTVMVDGKLKENVSLKGLLKIFLDFREECINKKFLAEKKANLDRTEVVEGFINVQKNLDEAIKIIRNANDAEEAQKNLIAKSIVKSDRQATAVLNMTLRSLTKLEENKLKNELSDLQKRLAWLEATIGNKSEIRKVIIEELDKISKERGDDRRTAIEDAVDDVSDEDLIKDEKVMISLSGEGYAKRIPSAEYRLQKRGGSGSKSANKKSEDGPIALFEGSTKDIMFFFTSKGRAFKRKAYQIPQSSKIARGTHVSNLLELNDDEIVTNMISLSDIPENGYLIMITKNGFIKRTKISEYDSSRKNAGINAIKLEGDDEVSHVLPSSGKDHLFIVTEQGNAIRYAEDVVPIQGRVTRGCRSMILSKGDKIAQIFPLNPESNSDIFIITSAGYGKKSNASEFRELKSRSVKGYAVANKDALSKRGGKVVGACALSGGESLLAITDRGQAIRFGEDEIRNTRRTTSGVKVVRLSDGDSVVRMAKLAAQEGEE